MSADPASSHTASHPRDDEDSALRELVSKAQGGDSRAFEEIYRLHVGRVYALCLRLTADAVQAETLTQDVFVRVWQKLGSYRGTGFFGGWLRRLTVNVVMEDRRTMARRRRLTESSWEESRMMEMRGATAGSKASRRSDASIDLDRAIATLPPGARKAFVLHDVEGYRHREIAEMAGVAAGTVKAQLHRARRMLREALDGPQEAIG